MAHEGAESSGGGGSGVVRELLAVFGIGLDTHELEEGENKLEEFGEKLKHVAAGIAGAFAVGELYEFAEAQVHAITAVEHLSAQLGLSTEQVQAWQYAAQASGFEAEKFTFAMSRLQAAAGSEHGAQAFSALGISIKDASGHTKDAAALFADVADKVKATEDPNKRAAIATKLFGRAGRELIPFLEKGSEGIKELTERYAQLGASYTEEDKENAKQFEEAHADMAGTFTALKNIIGRAVIPVMTKLIEWTTKIVGGLVALASKSYIVQAVLVALGAAATVFAVQMAAAAAPILLIAAAIGLLVLAVDDIITTFEGGDSLIRRGLDSLFGKGATTEGIEKLRDVWREVRNALQGAAEWITKYKNEAKLVADIALAIPKAVVKSAAYVGDKIGEAAGIDAQADAERQYHLAHPEAASSGGTRHDRASVYAPQYFQGSAGPGEAPGGGVLVTQTGDTNFNIYAAPGMDEKKLATAVNDTVEKHHRARLKDAHSTLPRAPGDR